MNTLQQQDDTAVSAKIDALHLIVEQLNLKVSTLLAAQGLAAPSTSVLGVSTNGRLTSSDESMGIKM